jgi:acetyl-CoA carboxylase biotin carboxyl carrier protein
VTKPKDTTPATNGEKKSAMTQIDNELVRQLAGVLNETGLTEIEYEQGGLRIRVARQLTGVVSAAAPVYAPAVGGGEAPAAAGGKPADPASHPGTVKSPMVGVAYLLPEPGAAPFVKVGDTVAEGQTLALIEAMKTFNPVKAPRGGKVTKILVESGSPVEYGEPLLIIE